MTNIDIDTKLEQQKKIAWSVATELSVTTKEDPVLIYQRLMRRYRDKQTNQYMSNNKSIES